MSAVSLDNPPDPVPRGTDWITRPIDDGPLRGWRRRKRTIITLHNAATGARCPDRVDVAILSRARAG